MNSKYKIHEIFFPWMRLNRIQRELDAEERAEYIKWYIEYYTKIWPKQQMELFKQKSLFLKFLKRKESKMKVYRCNECKEFFEGEPYAIMKLETRAVKSDLIGGLTVFEYDLCEKCYEKIKKERE